MPIRIEDPAAPVQGLFPGNIAEIAQPTPTVVAPTTPSPPGNAEAPSVEGQVVPVSDGTQEGDPQGLNIQHDRRDVNKGSGIRI